MPAGEAWFANSGVGMWLKALHRYGSRVTASELLSEPDGPEENLSEAEEEQAFAELNQLTEELTRIDPRPSRATRGFSGRGCWTDGSTDRGLVAPRAVHLERAETPGQPLG